MAPTAILGLLPPSAIKWAPAVVGVATHLLFFKRGEHHLHPLRYILAVFVALLAAAAILKGQNPTVSTANAVHHAFGIAGEYFAGLYSSLIIYRLFFNPLNKFPGPFWARLTALDLAFRVGKNRSRHYYLHEMHQKHGQFVRIGPNDLSVTDPDGVQVISGPNSKCRKAPWYSAEYPLSSLHSTRNRTEHDRRRRIWSPAFSIKSLRGYENRVKKYNDNLVRQIDAFGGKPIDMSKWFNFFSFDVMGDLGFGKSFNMLQSGEEHWAIKLLNDAQDAAGLALPIWIGRVFISMPFLRADYYRFLNFCARQINERLEVQGKQENPDITHTLVDEYYKRGPGEREKARLDLDLDSKLIIVAGSDTTAATLTYLFYYIAAVPGLAHQLRTEFEQLGDKDGLDHQKLQNANLLNSCINETLRLHPPVPSGVYRQTPPEGVHIGKTFIPGETSIQMPSHAMAYDESIYDQAHAFIPDRFSTASHTIKHNDAFNPFSTGPYGCIGKSLAYMEIRLLTYKLVTSYDIALAPGEDGSGLLQKSVDRFTLGMQPLNMVFKHRV